MTTYDVAVIGGGLAGCSAAISLAMQGWQVVLYEAKAYPQHKVCGEFLSPECAGLLDDLNALPALRALKPARIERARITNPQGMEWDTDLPDAGIGVSRYALDALLAERARAVGVTVHESTAVHTVQGNLGAGFQLQMRAPSGQERSSARAVIAAHGKRASLDRVLKRKFLRQSQPFIGMKMHFRGAPVPNRVELHTFDGGYCGLSEIEGGIVNACLLAREDVLRCFHGDTAAFVTWMGRQNPRLGMWLAQAQPVYARWLSISQIPFVPKPAVEQDILMAGDAAGLIAPLAGNGMSMALRGGQLAGQFISAYLAGALTPAALRQGYTGAWRREFELRLRLGRLLQAVMLRPAWLSLGLRAAQALPPLGAYFVHHTRSSIRSST